MGAVTSTYEDYKTLRAGGDEAEKLTQKKGITYYMYTVIAVMSILIISAVFAWIASVLLLMAADQENLSHDWKKIARGIGGFNIVLQAGLVVGAIFLIVKAVQYEHSNKKAMHMLYRKGGAAGLKQSGGTVINHTETDEVKPKISTDTTTTSSSDNTGGDVELFQ